ncbi:MAG: hypothetical protein LBD85_06200 [Oscillospiraceae bacterium]|jgi:hypothetical protein|nr:hypothetical protein [Oscillospiraceae bacterium]
MVKTKGKVSGCVRSLPGAKTFAVLMSVIKAAIKQGVSPHIAAGRYYSHVLQDLD